MRQKLMRKTKHKIYELLQN